jgi:hypothetical protein
VNDSNLFAGIDGGGIFVSTDNGVNWRTSSTGLTNKSNWGGNIIDIEIRK